MSQGPSSGPSAIQLYYLDAGTVPLQPVAGLHRVICDDVLHCPVISRADAISARFVSATSKMRQKAFLKVHAASTHITVTSSSALPPMACREPWSTAGCSRRIYAAARTAVARRMVVSDRHDQFASYGVAGKATLRPSYA